THDIGSLVVAGIHRQQSILYLRFREDAREFAAWLDRHLMRNRSLLPSIMRDFGALNVLHKRAAAPNVKRLQSIADAKYRLAHVVSILQKQFVYVVPQGISLCSLWTLFCRKFLRIDIG